MLTLSMDTTSTTAIASPLIDPVDAGRFLKVDRRTLANWRSIGKGPRFVRSGARVYYRLADLQDFLDQNTFSHAADERARRAVGR